MTSYYERKVENYKQQDRKAKRKIPNEGYVNVQCFFDNITNQCNYCGCGFHTSIKGGNITTNLTAQRVNNEYAHTLDNIVPYCKLCNCSCKWWVRKWIEWYEWHGWNEGATPCPFFWQDNMVLFLWHNIILCVYFKRHNCSNIFIQQQSYQTDLAHLPTRVSIPRKS